MGSNKALFKHWTGVLLAVLCLYWTPAFSDPCDEPLADSKNGPISKLTHAEKLAIADGRSTPELLQLLADQKDPEQWITIEVVQDQSHVGKAPPIPSIILTFAAQQAFNKKILAWLDGSRSKKDKPVLKKMFFVQKVDEFKGMQITLAAHVVVKMKIKDYPAIADWFVDSLYHKIWGNKVFKISLVE